MTSNETADLLGRYYEAWGTGDPDKVLAFFSDESVFEDLAFEARFEGAEAIRSFAVMTYAGVPDFRVEPHTVVANGRHAGASWTNTFLVGRKRSGSSSVPAATLVRPKVVTPYRLVPHSAQKLR